MLARESSSTRPAPLDRVDPTKVGAAWETWVIPCGTEPLNRLENLIERKFAEARAIGTGPWSDARERFDRFLAGVISSRPHRESLVRETDLSKVRALLEAGSDGRLVAHDLPRLAEELSGAPWGVRVDIAAELVHAAAPDRVGLLTRWVWNPDRRTGILGEFVPPPGPASYDGVQARLGELRLLLSALGFPSPTFASADILLALAYAARLSEATDRSFQGGGIESLLPGTLGVASMVLGVRRWVLDADR